MTFIRYFELSQFEPSDVKSGPEMRTAIMIPIPVAVFFTNTEIMRDIVPTAATTSHERPIDISRYSHIGNVCTKSVENVPVGEAWKPVKIGAFHPSQPRTMPDMA